MRTLTEMYAALLRNHHMASQAVESAREARLRAVEAQTMAQRARKRAAWVRACRGPPTESKVVDQLGEPG